jgi:hypothetical protein
LFKWRAKISIFIKISDLSFSALEDAVDDIVLNLFETLRVGFLTAICEQYD